MNTGNPAVDMARAAADITAAYAGNPTPNLTPEQLIKLFQDVHSAVSGASSGQAQQIGQQGNGLVAIAAPQTEQAAPPANSLKALVAASSVSAGVTHENIDPVVVWPNSTDEERAKFVALIKKHNIPLDANGVPRPRRPVDELVTGWAIVDPIDGKEFQMMRRRLRSAYDMDIAELRAMFHLPADFPVTAPHYSESKRRQAAESGLGKGPKVKKSEAEAVAESAAEATPIAAAKGKSGKTPAAKKTAGRRATAKAA